MVGDVGVCVEREQALRVLEPSRNRTAEISWMTVLASGKFMTSSVDAKATF
jgi:hypothetical protein